MGRKKLDFIKIKREYNSGILQKTIGLKYGVSYSTISRLLNKNGVSGNNVSDTLFSCFSANECYWAGFIAADGCVYQNRIIIEISSKDYEHLAAFRSFSGCRNNIRVFNRNGKSYCNFRFRSTSVVENLETHFNIKPRKTYNYIVPPLSIPDNGIRDFIRGYIDGDGSIYVTNNCVRLKITSSSEQLLVWFGEKMQKFISVVPNRLYNSATGAHSKDLIYSGNNAKSIINFIYKDNDQYRLKRKYDLAKEVCK